MSDYPGVFPDEHPLGFDLMGLFGALIGVGEGAALVYAAIFGVAPLSHRVVVGVLGVAWAAIFAFFLLAWSSGWFRY